MFDLDDTVASHQKDNKDGLLTQSINLIASRYRQEKNFIPLRWHYLVWSCPVMGAFSVFTGRRTNADPNSRCPQGNFLILIPDEIQVVSW